MSSFKTIDYRKGEFFIKPRHIDYLMERVGFITAIQGSVQSAKTEEFSPNIPNDFPTKDRINVRGFYK